MLLRQASRFVKRCRSANLGCQWHRGCCPLWPSMELRLLTEVIDTQIGKLGDPPWRRRREQSGTRTPIGSGYLCVVRTSDRGRRLRQRRQPLTRDDLLELPGWQTAQQPADEPWPMADGRWPSELGIGGYGGKPFTAPSDEMAQQMSGACHLLDLPRLPKADKGGRPSIHHIKSQSKSRDGRGGWDGRTGDGVSVWFLNPERSLPPPSALAHLLGQRETSLKALLKEQHCAQ
jgi:hypothetical protein